MEKLGQHFLTNLAAIKKIVSSLDIGRSELIVEIGPGKGALTFPLLEKIKEKRAKLIAIERDPALVEELEARIKKEEKPFIEVVCADAVKVLAQIIKENGRGPAGYKLVGNLPYYISGKILRVASELYPLPKKIAFMLQKEVAHRICAKPPRMNLLSASVQYWADPKVLLTLHPKDFNPSPQVYSSVLLLSPRTEQKEKSKEEKLAYYEFLRALFKQPRKTILNNLLSSRWKNERKKLLDALKLANLDQNSRSQDLTTSDILRLKRLIPTE